MGRANARTQAFGFEQVASPLIQLSNKRTIFDFTKEKRFPVPGFEPTFWCMT